MEDIKLVGVDIDGVSEPRNDGMDGRGGSTLYTVPITLSAKPSAEWGRFFVEAWDHPESFTTQHRPRIATVQGNKVVLSGTTLEEIDRVHKPTLKAAVARANENERQRLAQDAQDKEAKLQESYDFRQHVADMADKITFD